MKNKICLKLVSILFLFSTVGFADSNVDVRIILRAVSHLEMIKEVACNKVSKDLMLTLNFETFIVGDSGLYLELVELRDLRKYYLIKNNEAVPLTPNTSINVKVLPRGSHKNAIQILVKDSKLSACEDIADRFIVTIVPL